MSGSGPCFTHWVYGLLRENKVRPRRGWTERSRRILDIILVRMTARFDEVLAGRPPITRDEASIAAFELRQSLGIGWGDRKGLAGTARVIYRIEKKAKELR